MAMKMDVKSIIEQIEIGDQVGALMALKSYNKEMNHCFTFSREEEHDRKRLGELVLGFLNEELAPSSQLACLETVRILSRDQRCLDPFVNQAAMSTLARYAHIATARAAVDTPGDGPAKVDGEGGNEVNDESKETLEQEVIAEALKAICNILLHSETGQMVAADLQLITGVSESLKVCHDPSRNHEVCFFMLRLTFLLTALRVDVRAQLAQELHGVSLLGQQLDAILGLCWQDTLQPARAGFENVQAKDLPSLSPQQAELAMEVLKILFNLTFDTATRTPKEEEAAQYRHLGAILTHCLMSHVDGVEQSEEFHSHTVNLLGNLPLPCLDVLLMPQMQRGSTEYMGLNMDAIETLLEFMEKRLEQGRRLKETLLPSLNLLTQIAQNHRETRKYLRSKVLPPLRDVTNRPETGDTLRNKLVRLMTHIDTDVKDCAAEFLFVLCKENVSRFVKYTGYGNAAGLLAARGLLRASKDPGIYSEDEDSETEEYREAKAHINPITGVVEEEQPDPMEGMTEEQKEYEAMKLVSMFNKLSRTNVIQPMQLGVDGQMRTWTPEDIETQAHNRLSLPQEPANSDSEDDA